VTKRRSLTMLVAMLLLVGVSVTALALGARPNLGLDLQGGISAVYTPELLEGEEEPEDFEEVLDETIEVLRNRIDSLGVVEPDIARQGTDILVQLPGVTDAERVQEIIGTPAQLEFRPVDRTIEPGDPDYDEGPDCTLPVDEREVLPRGEAGILCGDPENEAVPDPETGDPIPRKFSVGETVVTGDSIADARPQIGDAGGFSVGLDLDSTGAGAFGEVTSDLACQRDQGEVALLSIVLDGNVQSALSMGQDVFCGTGLNQGSAQLTVGQQGEDRGEAEATDLALVLRAGALPITLQEATFETVSATLGEDSLRSGILAGLIGLGLVAAWMITFYRTLGVVAVLELLVFGALLAGTIAALGELAGQALTLAGIAGIIVSIGITADSSILYRERIREEVNFGKTPRTAVHTAFGPTFRTNLSGNTVTLAAALILYFLAVGPVRGFALMLGIATILDLLIFGTFTRAVVSLLSTTKLISRESLRAVPRSEVRERPAVTRESKPMPSQASKGGEV
jgi:preprotein translocase subunit SecD